MIGIYPGAIQEDRWEQGVGLLGRRARNAGLGILRDKMGSGPGCGIFGIEGKEGGSQAYFCSGGTWQLLKMPKNSPKFPNNLIPCSGTLPRGNFPVQIPRQPGCSSSQWEKPLGAFSSPKSHPWNSLPSRRTQGREQFRTGLGLLPRRSWGFRKF